MQLTDTAPVRMNTPHHAGPDIHRAEAEGREGARWTHRQPCETYRAEVRIHVNAKQWRPVSEDRKYRVSVVLVRGVKSVASIQWIQPRLSDKFVRQGRECGEHVIHQQQSLQHELSNVDQNTCCG